MTHMVDVWTITALLSLAVKFGTPLLLACLGEIYCERAGVLNLGLEGCVVLGAAVGFVAALLSESLLLGFVAAALSGALLGLIHAVVSVHLRGNQIVSGLAITIIGSGVACVVARSYIGLRLTLSVPEVRLPVRLPVVSAFVEQDVVVYASIVLAIVMWFVLRYTRFGLVLRAVGESPIAAEMAGVDVCAVRTVGCVLSGSLAAVGGAYLTLVYMRTWSELVAVGRGWIALALVIVSLWSPLRAVACAYLFGSLYALQVVFQAMGLNVHLVRMIPYVATIAVLAIASRLQRTIGAPVLGRAYIREEEALHGA